MSYTSLDFLFTIIMLLLVILVLFFIRFSKDIMFISNNVDYTPHLVPCFCNSFDDPRVYCEIQDIVYQKNGEMAKKDRTK